MSENEGSQPDGGQLQGDQTKGGSYGAPQYALTKQQFVDSSVAVVSNLLSQLAKISDGYSHYDRQPPGANPYDNATQALVALLIATQKLL